MTRRIRALRRYLVYAVVPLFYFAIGGYLALLAVSRSELDTVKLLVLYALGAVALAIWTRISIHILGEQQASEG